MSNIQPNWFSLFKNNDNIDEGISDKFIEVLKKCARPHIICIYGDARTGKSTKMNQIINGIIANNYFNLKEPFETRREIYSTMTKGCNFYGPIKIKDIANKNNIDICEIDKEIINDELFFVDTEGLRTIDKTTKSCVSGILTILQIASIKILYTPLLDNEKLEEAAKNVKLSNILNLINNESQIIVLIKDVRTDEKIERRIMGDLGHQKKECENKINDYFQEIDGNINAICEILPSYDLASRDVEPFPYCYKEKMKNLVLLILTNIRNNNMDGPKLIDIIKDFLEIFKKVKDIENMKNTENAINMILSELFKEKILKIYLDILDKVDQFDKNIVSLYGNIKGIKKYFFETIKNKLINTWDIFEKAIKNDIEKEIEIYISKLDGYIKSAFDNKKNEIEKQMNTIIYMEKNEDIIINYLNRINFREEVNKKEIDNNIDKEIKSFFDENKLYFECMEIINKDYKNKINDYLKKNLIKNVTKIINSKKDWKNYLRNVIFDIQKNILNPFKNKLKTKSKEEITEHLNNNLDELKKKIQLYIPEKKIIKYNEKDFDYELKEIFNEIIEELKNQIKLLDNQISKEQLEMKLLKSKTIPDGIYIIYAMHCQNKVLNVFGASKEENAKVCLYEFNNTDAQKFEILYNASKKYYTIKCLCSGKYINVNQSNYHINQLSENNSPNQHWHIVSVGNDYEIISELNGRKKYLEVSGGKSLNGTDIILGSKTGAANQHFKFEIPPPPPPPKHQPKPIPAPIPVPIPVSYFPIPNFHHPYTDRNSIVDALKSIGVNSSLDYRAIIGRKNNIPGIPGDKAYNITMLNLLKSGRLIKP